MIWKKALLSLWLCAAVVAARTSAGRAAPPPAPSAFAMKSGVEREREGAGFMGEKPHIKRIEKGGCQENDRAFFNRRLQVGCQDIDPSSFPPPPPSPPPLRLSDKSALSKRTPHPLDAGAGAAFAASVEAAGGAADASVGAAAAPASEAASASADFDVAAAVDAAGSPPARSRRKRRRPAEKRKARQDKGDLHQILHAPDSETLKKILDRQKERDFLKQLCEAQKQFSNIPSACYRLQPFDNAIDPFCLRLRLKDLETEALQSALALSEISPTCRGHLKKQLKILNYRKLRERESLPFSAEIRL